MRKMSMIERKVLGAVIAMSNSDGVTQATTKQIADQMNYKATGGVIGMALKMLEGNNYIAILNEPARGGAAGQFKVLV